jgi:hypothetical protein
MPIPAEASFMSLPCWAIAARNSESLSFVDADSSTTALTNATTSGVRIRTVSVRPSWYRRVWAAS